MGKVIVVKVGGSVLENLDPGFFAGCARMQKTEGLSLVIVHGGGPFISRWMERIGKKPAFVDGRRVTDGETLNIAEMALAGQVNKELVSRFAREGVAVLGLSGVDLNLLQVEPEDPKLGYVGKVTAVHAERLQTILQQGWLPVIASLGIDGQGKVLNVNADEAAGAIARALGAEQLVMVSDVDGVYIEDTLLSHMNPAMIETYIAQGAITGGMIPKVRSAVRSLEGSVREVRIVSGKKAGIFDPVSGTRILKEGVDERVALSHIRTP
ncbi:acetylglutamate kinase [Thermoactinomyces daqus]|uniref:Acetylglutamate kinase n=1 Tax=Thermoactinomyces daqus TaxID=1329516 RepID=A0A7W2AH37_9BACL|nr:acetylglutamate kinase [Thermoactinomyces daqus]MBA4541770.1 acetylglutamate kinase [Thermoactinomyces daqus]